MTASSPALPDDHEVFEIGVRRQLIISVALFLPLALLVATLMMVLAWGSIGLIPAGFLSIYALVKWLPSRKRWNLTAQGVDFDKPYHGRIDWWHIDRIELNRARVRFEYRYISDEQMHYMHEKLKEGVCITPADQYSEKIPLRWTGLKADDVEQAIARLWPEATRKLETVLERD